MSLSTLEKLVLRDAYKYYSGLIQNIPYDEVRTLTIMEGTEEERRRIVVEYLTNIVKPGYENTLSNMQLQTTDIQNKLTQINNYLGQ